MEMQLHSFCKFGCFCFQNCVIILVFNTNNSGIGALLSFSGLVQHIKHAKRFYILIEALLNGLPNVIRFLISITPIYLGFVVAGTTWFGHYSSYVSFLNNSSSAQY